jgi:hypothetical protein
MTTETMMTDSQENSAEVGIDVQRLVRLLDGWEDRLRATPERAKEGGVNYVGGLVDAYGTCYRALQEIVEANND